MFTYKDWEDFCNYLIYSNRYILDNKRKAIVDEIIKLAKQGEDTIKKDTIFWRARINNRLKIENNEVILAPYTNEEMMMTPPEVVRSGRANPPGISYLYLADNRETAIAEVKPYLSARIDLISVRLKKDIKIIDFQKPLRFSTMWLLSLSKEEIDKINNIWFGMQLSFSVPLPPEDELGYIPTQYIAELFKNKGYEGIVYESVQRKNNHNLVLFDRSNVEPVGRDERSLYEIEYIDNVAYARKKVEEGAA
jgi:hypothetical protein